MTTHPIHHLHPAIFEKSLPKWHPQIFHTFTQKLTFISLMNEFSIAKTIPHNAIQKKKNGNIIDTRPL